MTTVKRRDAIENRAALLGAARIVLNRDPDASLEVIATEAGLSRRAVYGHFSTRDELVREVTVNGAARVAAALEGTSDADPLVELALVSARLWDEVESIRLMAVYAVRGPFRSQIAGGLAPLRAMVLAAVRRGQSSGTVRTDLDAERLARLVEDSLLAVFDESTRSELDSAAGHRLVMLNVLGTVGLSWRDANELIDQTDALK